MEHQQDITITTQSLQTKVALSRLHPLAPIPYYISGTRHKAVNIFHTHNYCITTYAPTLYKTYCFALQKRRFCMVKAALLHRKTAAFATSQLQMISILRFQCVLDSFLPMGKYISSYPWDRGSSKCFLFFYYFLPVYNIDPCWQIFELVIDTTAI